MKQLNSHLCACGCGKFLKCFNSIYWSGHYPRTEKTKMKISISNKIRCQQSEYKNNILTKTKEGKIKAVETRKQRALERGRWFSFSEDSTKKRSIARKKWWIDARINKVDLLKERNIKISNYGRGRPKLSIRGENSPNKKLEVRKKISIANIEYYKYADGPWKNKTLNFNHRLNIRNGHIKRIERTNLQGMPLMPCIGNHEKELLDRLENALCLEFKRQYKVLGYFLDGYNKERKIAAEVDEKWHEDTKERDIRRQQEIERELGCKFYRIKDY